MHLSSWTSKLHERFARNFQHRSQLFPGPFGVAASPPSAHGGDGVALACCLALSIFLRAGWTISIQSCWPVLALIHVTLNLC